MKGLLAIFGSIVVTLLVGGIIGQKQMLDAVTVRVVELCVFAFLFFACLSIELWFLGNKAGSDLKSRLDDSEQCQKKCQLCSDLIEDANRIVEQYKSEVKKVGNTSNVDPLIGKWISNSKSRVAQEIPELLGVLTTAENDKPEKIPIGKGIQSLDVGNLHNYQRRLREIIEIVSARAV